MDPDECQIELGYYEGPLAGLLAAIERAGCFEGAVLELDGSAAYDDDELRELLAEMTRQHPRLAERNRRAREDGREIRLPLLGRVWLGSGPTPVTPIEGDNLKRLRGFLDRHADPELAIELNVFDDDGYLLSAPDVGANVLSASPRVPPAALEAMRAALREHGSLRVE